MKILFICTLNIQRSRTAEGLFRDQYDTKSAGIVGNPVTEEQLNWADTVIVMEEWHREELTKRFPKISMKKKIICLGIPDEYYYNDPELIRLLKLRMKKSGLRVK